MNKALTTTSGNSLPSPLRHQLTPIEQAITEQLPADLRHFVQLRQEKPIRVLAPMDLRGYCHEVIVKAFLDYTGGQTEAAIITFQTQALQDEFTKFPNFRDLTISEVKNAFTMGIRNAYGDFFGMCGRTYHQFLQGFITEEKRAQAWARYRELLKETEEDPEKAADIKMKRSKQALKDLFASYKETGKLERIALYTYYKVLADLIGTEVEYAPGKFYKSLVVDKETREKLNQQAEREFNELPQPQELRDSIYDNTKKPLETLINKVNPLLSKEDALTNLKKEVALRWYFDQLIQQNKDLEL